MVIQIIKLILFTNPVTDFTYPVTEKDLGLRNTPDNFTHFEVVDKEKFFSAVNKHSIEYEEVKC